MKNQTKLTLALTFLIAGVLFIQSCKKDDEKKEETTSNEFIADSTTFASFMNWPLEATKNGADPSLGMAHAGNDSTAIRRIYFKDGVNPVNGVYPIGAVVVKHTTNTGNTLNEYTGMVKRGNGFNPTKGDWEFFVLTMDGKIAEDSGMPLRGANLMGGMCGNCHAGAASKDYIFSK
ncbi:MAG: cytochrome P460 family protein [Bacteroidia bacterium]